VRLRRAGSLGAGPPFSETVGAALYTGQGAASPSGGAACCSEGMPRAAAVTAARIADPDSRLSVRDANGNALACFHEYAGRHSYVSAVSGMT
jgi:hypothetical protein